MSFYYFVFTLYIKNKCNLIPFDVPKNYWISGRQCIVCFCVEVLWPSQPYGVMSSMVSLPYHNFTGQA